MECTICKEDFDTPENPLISPCACNGSVGRSHRGCIEEWVVSSGRDVCTVCNQTYAQQLEYNGPFPQFIVDSIWSLRTLKGAFAITGGFAVSGILTVIGGDSLWNYFSTNLLTFTRVALLKASGIGIYAVAGIFVGLIRQVRLTVRNHEYFLDGDRLIQPTIGLLTLAQFWMAQHHVTFTGNTWPTWIFWWWSAIDLFDLIVINGILKWYRQKYYHQLFINQN